MVPGILFTCYGLKTVPIVSTFVPHGNNGEFLLYNFWRLLGIRTVYDPFRVSFFVSLTFSHALTQGCI